METGSTTMRTGALQPGYDDTARHATARRLARDLVRAGRERRQDFVVRGSIDGVPVIAQRVNGRLLVSPALRSRAALVVALGETFGDATRGALSASVSGPALTVALTHARACDRIGEISVQGVTVTSRAQDHAEQ